MKIVVLDGFTLNPGDLSWTALEALGDCVVYDRTVRGLVVDRAREAEVVFTNKVVLGRAEFAQLPKLRYIGVLATGYNVVDVAAARERGIVVTNIPAYGTRSVAQMTFSLILELAQNGGLYGIAGKGQCKNGEILFTAAHWKAVNPNNVIREINKKSTGGAK